MTDFTVTNDHYRCSVSWTDAEGNRYHVWIDTLPGGDA